MWYSSEKGFGVIERDQGGDVRVHWSAIVTNGYRTLIEGQRVEFDLVRGRNGLEARNVRVSTSARRGSSARGTVTWYSSEKGFGVIERDQGGDVRVHWSAIVTNGYRTLIEGQRVEFEVVQGANGLEARNVRVV